MPELPEVETIRRGLKDEGIRPSDRRFKQSLSLLQAKALVNQRRIVKVEDLSILEHALWETVDQIETVSNIIHNHSDNVVTQALYSIQNEANDVFYSVLHDYSTEFGMEASQKMKILLADLNNLKSNNQARTSDIDASLNKVNAMQHEILNRMLEPWYFEALDDKKESTSSFFKM